MSSCTNFKNLNVYLVKKVVIPPLSKCIVSLKCAKNVRLDECNCNFVFEPVKGILAERVLAARTICNFENGLFTSLMNLTRETITLNKNLKMGNLFWSVDASDLENFSTQQNISGSSENVPCYEKSMGESSGIPSGCVNSHNSCTYVNNFSNLRSVDNMFSEKNDNVVCTNGVYHLAIDNVDKCVSDETPGNFSNFLNETEPIAAFDHADLCWSSEINLDHLEPPLKVKITEFLNQNRDVFASSVLDLPGCNTVPYEIHLKDNTPIKCKAYRVPHHLRPELDAQLDILLKADIIEPSVSEFASPVILVKKADNSYRLAVDFRRLNKNLVKDAYPLPNITDSVDALSGSNFFTTLDLTSGFFQQIIRPEDRHKTAIITHRGLFSWKRSPFGMSTSAGSFQRLMNYVLGDLANDGILVYIDDIIIASKDVDSHLKKLDTVFTRLRQHNLRLKPNKCTFLSNKIKYLGFEISSGQVAPVNKNIEVIKNFKVPHNRKTLRSFIGTLTYYRRFVPDFSKRAIHLTNLTKETGKFVWTTEAQEQFEDLKNALISKPCLTLPDFSREFAVYTDASGEALGCVLTQTGDDGFPHPIAFASRKLKGAETRYSATERELLALVWATAHFKCYLANSHFTIFTDHAPLTYMLKIRDPTSRIAKWVCSLSDFHFTVKYIKGKCNSVADFLSRYVQDPVNIENFVGMITLNDSPNVFAPKSDLLDKIKIAQKSDEKCTEIAVKLSKNVKIAPTYLKFFFEDDILVCMDTRNSLTLSQNKKVVVPEELVPEIFSVTHDSVAGCHQGYSKTLHRIREHFYWPKMTVHIKNLIDSCVSCQQLKAPGRSQLAPLQRMDTPTSPFSTIHSDILGPLNITESGNKYLITYIDAFSKWPEAYPVPATNSEIVADTLADFISRHGAPNIMITDRGSNFMSKAMETVYKKFNIKHISTTAYHPSSNGKQERVHKTITNALTHLVNENQSDWDIKLKFALLAIRTSVHESTKMTPAAVTYGRTLNLPYAVFEPSHTLNYNDTPSYCDLLIPALQSVYKNVHSKLIQASERQEKYREKTAVDKHLRVGDLVWLYTPKIKPGQCKKLSKLNTGPFLITEKLSEVNFRIVSEEKPGNSQVVHADRLTKVIDRFVFTSNVGKQTQSQGVVPTNTATENESTIPSTMNHAPVNRNSAVPNSQGLEETDDRRRRWFFPLLDYAKETSPASDPPVSLNQPTPIVVENSPVPQVQVNHPTPPPARKKINTRHVIENYKSKLRDRSSFK